MALNVQQKRIASFLVQGLKASQIASIVNVSPSYISQLCGEAGPPEFKEAVQELSAKAAETVDEDKIITDKYLATEHKLLSAIENSMCNAEFSHLVNALKVVGERQERRASRKAGIINPQQIGLVQNNITVLNLPAHAVPEYQVNGQGQVVAIGDKVMSPLSSSGVRKLFMDRKAEAGVVKQEPEYIPAGETVPEDF